MKAHLPTIPQVEMIGLPLDQDFWCMHQVIMAVENILNLLPSYKSTPVSFHAKHLIDNLVANSHDRW
jgi:hypothetical protein